ncbi:MAG: MinD/ParA family protein [Bdellovibrionales bacterium]
MRKTRTISISSGKGGVGKTSIVCNLALALQDLGKRVLILDGDWGMANVDIMFGKRSKYSLIDLLRDDITIEDVLERMDQKIYLIPGGNALPELLNLNLYERKFIFDQVSELNGVFDYLIIDTAPGIDENVRFLNAAAEESYFVLTPEPASLTDTYSLIKVMNQVQKEVSFNIVCNEVSNAEAGLSLFKRLAGVCDKFLNVNLNYFGSIDRDFDLAQSTCNQKLVLREKPDSKSAQDILQLADNISDYNGLSNISGNIKIFFESYVDRQLSI